MFGLSPEEIAEAARECPQNDLIESIHRYDINNPNQYRHRYDYYENYNSPPPAPTLEQTLGIANPFHNIDRVMREYFNFIEREISEEKGNSE